MVGRGASAGYPGVSAARARGSFVCRLVAALFRALGCLWGAFWRHEALLRLGLRCASGHAGSLAAAVCRHPFERIRGKPSKRSLGHVQGKAACSAHHGHWNREKLSPKKSALPTVVLTLQTPCSCKFWALNGYNPCPDTLF